MYRWVGPNPAQPRLVPGTRELIDRLEVTHYEALDREVDELPVGALELAGPAAAGAPGAD